MASTILAAVLLISQGTTDVFADIKVNLNPSSGKTRCGETITMNPGNETTVYASGSVPNGHCTIYFTSPQSNDYSCEKFCVTLRSMKFRVCNVKVKFTAINFHNQADLSKKFDCYDSISDAWCPVTDKLQMDVLEGDRYSFEGMMEGYNLTVDISPVCKSAKHKLLKRPVSDFNRKREEQMRKNRIEGTVAGVCLACIFLVLMVVMYIYYKNKPTENHPEEDGEKQTGGKLWNLKNKLKGRRKSNVVCIESETFENYQKVSQTDDDDVKQTEQPSTSENVSK